MPTDTIDGSGFPLAFRVNSGAGAAVVVNRAGRDVFYVEARAMGRHQKEAVVRQGESGSAWRFVSDEGPMLRGNDLAPFPLAYFNAGLQADLINRISYCGKRQSIDLNSLEVGVETRYAFTGSFFKGTGRGSAESPRIQVKAATAARAEIIQGIVTAAIRGSPALAAVRVPLKNTFALYVNGKRRPVQGVHASSAPDAVDPFKAHQRLPQPLAGMDELASIIEKPPHTSAPQQRLPGTSDRVDIVIGGKGRCGAHDGTTVLESWLERPAGSLFRFRTDERGNADEAPSGLALLSAGIAFCYMTQLIRYVEYLKYKVRSIRLVQMNPFRLDKMSGDGALVAAAEPVDTHLFLTAEEPDEVMQNLLLYAAETCYLHACLAGSSEPQLSL